MVGNQALTKTDIFRFSSRSKSVVIRKPDSNKKKSTPVKPRVRMRGNSVPSGKSGSRWCHSTNRMQRHRNPSKDPK